MFLLAHTHSDHRNSITRLIKQQQQQQVKSEINVQLY